MARRLNETEDHILSILHDHGATVFEGAKRLLACAWLLKNGYIIEYGGGAFSIQPKGVRWLNSHNGPL